MSARGGKTKPIRWLILLLVLAAAVPGAGQEPESWQSAASEGAAWSASAVSPYRTLGKSEQLLDAAARRIALALDYSPEGRDERPRRIGGLPGIQAARYLVKPAPEEGWKRTVELALGEYPDGGFVLHAVASESNGIERRPSPELRTIEGTLAGLLADLEEVRATSPAGVLGPTSRFAGYKLSYIQSDRAAALLKVLGYSVIEFQTTNPQATVYDKIFDAAEEEGEYPLPVVIRLIDSEKTSLLEPVEGGGGRSSGGSDSLSLGGLFLDRITDGVPQQRLLIAYDPADPEPMQRLVNLLRDQIDVPAQQVLIEALVVELDRTHLDELGIDFEASKDGAQASFTTDVNGLVQPFALLFQRPSPKTLLELNIALRALVTRGQAEVLSRPSVLVLDGRQARIQVGQKIPYTSNIAATNTGTLTSTEYLTTGIVLNLRPRVAADGSEITMQVETLISSAGPSGFISETGVLVAPPIQSREVQSLVRVANNTPFVIGGLISSNDQTNVNGLPGLSKIPVLGALFRRKARSQAQKEVIVVITPHVIPVEDRAFSYVIPKESEIFESFGNELFRNAYYLRASDLFDVGFVYQSEVLADLRARLEARAEVDPGLRDREPFQALLAGRVPGEDILVRRMLLEVIQEKGFETHVDPAKIFFFQQTGDEQGLQFTHLEPLLPRRLGNRGETLVLSFEGLQPTTMERPFDPPRAAVSYEQLAPDGYLERLRRGNQRREDGGWSRNTVLLTDAFAGSTPPLERLRAVLVLKRMLELNSELPLDLDSFHVGREIVFPSVSDLHDRFHLVDREVARLFYETDDYYLALEQEFTRVMRSILERLDGGG